MKRAVLASLMFMLSCGGEVPRDASVVQGLQQVSGFGSNPGGLLMRIHVPQTVPARAPLVLALHGCTQSAADYVGAGWNDLADTWGFYVLYPEQKAANGCFRWYDAAHARRGKGDALSIKQMVDHMLATHDIDPRRVFITGLSAGGAMTAVMLAAYPDVFSAGAVMAGIPYRCADSVMDGYGCMFNGKTLTANAWGDLVRGAASGYGGPWPRLAVWHGTSDYLVRPVNQQNLVLQWTDVHGIDSIADAQTVEGPATRYQYRDATGQTRVESWSVTGMAHGVAVDPGFSAAGGCGQTGAYALDLGLCSTYHTGLFFGLGAAGSPPAQNPPAQNPPAQNPPAQNPPAQNPPAQSTCTEVLDANYYHVVAGRAHRCGAYNVHVCANGSQDQLGLWNMIQTWVRQTGPGYFELGRCP